MAYLPVIPDEILLQNLDSYSSYILLLAEPVSHQQIPIVIGSHEAQAIILAKEQVEANRPLTHTLMHSLMNEYNLSVKKVTIDRFSEGIFYATLCVSDGFNEKKLDCRPSDAVALALLGRCPIMVSDTVLDEVGIMQSSITDNLPKNQPNLDDLEAELKRCEENEEYERAAEIMEQINKLKN